MAKKAVTTQVNNGVIIQFAEGDTHNAMLELVKPLHSTYAFGHDLDLRVLNDTAPMNAAFFFLRYQYLLDALREGYEYAFYLETDVLINNNDVDMRRMVKNKPIGMAFGSVPGGEPEHFNTGVIAVKNDPQAIEWLQAVLDKTPPEMDEETGVWWERPNCQQVIANDLLKLDTWANLVERLDNRWNYPVTLGEPQSAYIVAWHGVQGEANKLARMREYIGA